MEAGEVWSEEESSQLNLHQRRHPRELRLDETANEGLSPRSSRSSAVSSAVSSYHDCRPVDEFAETELERRARLSAGQTNLVYFPIPANAVPLVDLDRPFVINRQAETTGGWLWSTSVYLKSTSDKPVAYKVSSSTDLP